ncbi:MAG TPA: hypothetical protein VMS77_04175 [Conexivisphaerales archaeon]|nr:hypothetical protein [Conexivisphaerales archaeon]
MGYLAGIFGGANFSYYISSAVAGPRMLPLQETRRCGTEWSRQEDDMIGRTRTAMAF